MLGLREVYASTAHIPITRPRKQKSRSIRVKREAVMVSDLLFTSVSRANPYNSQTIGVLAADQTKISEFLTVQSLVNFAAMTGAITVAWKALQTLNHTFFASHWVPFVFAVAWLAVSLLASATQPNSALGRNYGAWAVAIFIGLLNALVLFAAVVGIS